MATDKSSSSSRPPATTLEARENQLIAAAVDAAEKQLLAGTASAAVIVHYLKLGSTRERLEQQRLIEENKLLVAKAEAMAKAEASQSMYQEALNAFRAYSGQEPVEDRHGDFDDD